MWPLPYDNTGVTVELGQLVDAGLNVWDFEYPSFYEGEAKKAFEDLVLAHYRFRQIGQETPARWLHYFRTRVREIMPYYIQVYKSVELMQSVEDPFKAYDLTETYSQETTGQSTSQGETNQSSRGNDSVETTENGFETMHDTPQGEVRGMLMDDYMSNAKQNTRTATENHTISNGTDTTDEQSASNSGTMTYTLTRQGNIGVQPLGQEIEAYRKALINVDQMVIDELNDLFLQVY